MAISPADVLKAPSHRAFLNEQAHKQFDFFDASLRPDAGFYTLNIEGRPIDSDVQELHSTTRMVHSYALGKIAGRSGCEQMIDQGMAYLLDHHKDAEQGGYLWSLNGNGVQDGQKLAYGHVFVLLAASSALVTGHPQAQTLLDDIDRILDEHFWEEDRGLFREEWNRDWTPFSQYRGMNANMHGVEALLSAFEATGREKYLMRAQRILNFFIGTIAPSENWRLPEHYTEDWTIDRAYGGNPMFRPSGTTPGHSLEWARLLLQYNELSDSRDDARIQAARNLTERALSDAWDVKNGGFFYTLNFDGTPAIKARYWWPVTEAIGTMAALLKVDPTLADAEWYQRLWGFAEKHFIDAERGGWFPEIDDAGIPTGKQFLGKPDIYHSIQATLFPLTPQVSNVYEDLSGVLKA